MALDQNLGAGTSGTSTTRTGSRRSSGGSPRKTSVHRCMSREEFYEFAGSTIVVTLLILSPPIVLVGVILLTTGAIMGKIFILAAGLATILSGVLVATLTAFVFVRMRGGAKNRGSCGRTTTTSSAQCGNASSRGNYYRVKMDLERSSNSADGAFRVEITDQPSTMVTFFSSAESEIQPLPCRETECDSDLKAIESECSDAQVIGMKVIEDMDASVGR